MTTTLPPAAADARGAARRLRRWDAALPDGDGVAVFNGVYLSVTEELARRCAAGAFHDPVAAAVLGACFAERYLAAVEASAEGRLVPACWRPLFQWRCHPGISRLQFAMAGINAHVGHDLALAVVDTCVRLDCEPRELEGDFDRVGSVLAEIEERVREELMPGPDLLDVADPLTHLAGAWCLGRARDAAWAASRVLWGLRRTEELYTEVRERLDSGVGLVNRCLLIPLRGSSCTRRR